jgi:ATP-binding protein involved in chromosome partitioning
VLLALITRKQKEFSMRIAIPVSDGILSQHFGHCEKFAVVDVDPETKTTLAASEVAAPEHQPGLLPSWLKERGVDVVIAGGMGAHAIRLFEAASIRVAGGAPGQPAEDLVRRYLAGELTGGPAGCNHSGCHH